MSYTKAAIVLVALACLVTVGGAKDILFPNMTPEKGSYDKPAGTMGEKTKNPWSATTLAAGVDGKPLAGKVVTVVGEIIDLSCYTSLGKHGTKHRDCGQKCVKNGQPVGLLAKDGSIYLLVDEEHDQRRDGLTNFRAACVEHMAYVMEVTGTLSVVEGMKTLHVRGYVKK
ncbi:MAG: hypothetical protein HY289_12365 [Planctomycetes bacterium]|nr:hypothetical protein [Planctomycetota bacterium]